MLVQLKALIRRHSRCNHFATIVRLGASDFKPQGAARLTRQRAIRMFVFWLGGIIGTGMLSPPHASLVRAEDSIPKSTSDNSQSKDVTSTIGQALKSGEWGKVADKLIPSIWKKGPDVGEKLWGDLIDRWSTQATDWLDRNGGNPYSDHFNGSEDERNAAKRMLGIADSVSRQDYSTAAKQSVAPIVELGDMINKSVPKLSEATDRGSDYLADKVEKLGLNPLVQAIDDLVEPKLRDGFESQPIPKAVNKQTKDLQAPAKVNPNGNTPMTDNSDSSATDTERLVFDDNAPKGQVSDLNDNGSNGVGTSPYQNTSNRTGMTNSNSSNPSVQSTSGQSAQFAGITTGLSSLTFPQQPFQYPQPFAHTPNGGSQRLGVYSPYAGGQNWARTYSSDSTTSASSTPNVPADTSTIFFDDNAPKRTAEELNNSSSNRAASKQYQAAINNSGTNSSNARSTSVSGGGTQRLGEYSPYSGGQNWGKTYPSGATANGSVKSDRLVFDDAAAGKPSSVSAASQAPAPLNSNTSRVGASANPGMLSTGNVPQTGNLMNQGLQAKGLSSSSFTANAIARWSEPSQSTSPLPHQATSVAGMSQTNPSPSRTVGQSAPSAVVTARLNPGNSMMPGSKTNNLSATGTSFLNRYGTATNNSGQLRTTNSAIRPPAPTVHSIATQRTSTPLVRATPNSKPISTPRPMSNLTRTVPRTPVSVQRMAPVRMPQTYRPAMSARPTFHAPVSRSFGHR